MPNIKKCYLVCKFISISAILRSASTIASLPAFSDIPQSFCLSPSSERIVESSRSPIRSFSSIISVSYTHLERRGRAGAASGTKKGRPPKLDKKVEEDLIAENQRLRMEIEYLKKLDALVQNCLLYTSFSSLHKRIFLRMILREMISTISAALQR